MTKNEFTSMVESCIATSRYAVNNLDTNKYVNALYEDYLVEKKDASEVAARIFPRILKDMQIISEYQYITRMYNECGMDNFITK